MSSIERQPPRRAETLPVRFAVEPTAESLRRRSRRDSKDFHNEAIERRASSYKRYLHTQIPQHRAGAGRRRSLYDEDIEPRNTRDDHDRYDEEWQHDERSRTFQDDGVFVDRRQRSEPSLADPDEDPYMITDSSRSNDDVIPRRHPRRRRRSRSRYPLKPIISDGYSNYGVPVIVTESDEEYDVYNDFILTTDKKSPLVPDSTLESAVEHSEKGSIFSESQTPGNGSNTGKVLHIIRSQYTGDGSIGGLQAAQLTAIHDVNKNSRSSCSPVFRWM